MSDLNLLKVMLNRKDYISTYKDLPLDSYDEMTRWMLKWFKLYLATYAEDVVIDVDKLQSLITLKSPSKLPDDQQTKLNLVLKGLQVPIDSTVRDVTLSSLGERKLVKEVEMMCRQWNDGDEIDFIHDLALKAVTAREKIAGSEVPSWCDTDILELLRLNADDSGYKFDFLPYEFNSKLKGVRESHNIAIAADTNKGKTSFFCRSAVSFAKQRVAFQKLHDELVRSDDWVEPDGYKPMVFRPILYLVNEGTAEMITPRLYQTALGIDNAKMIELAEAGKLTKMYEDVVGRKDAIRLRNIHGWTLGEVSKYIESHNPFMVITDMTGRVRLGGSGGKSDIDKLEAVWDGFRTLASPNLLDFIHMGSAQISAEGKNMMYPPLSALQNSKTGIQTTLDLGIWLGYPENSQGTPDEYVRGISTAKNKLPVVGESDYIKCEVMFDPHKNTWD